MMKLPFMISCEKSAKLVSEAMDHHLPLPKRIILWMHHNVCKLCVLYAQQLTQLRSALNGVKHGRAHGGVEDSVELPDETRDRIIKNIDHTLGQSPISDEGTEKR